MLKLDTYDPIEGTKPGQANMSLSSLHLDAFHAVARTLNFSRAAKSLHITQSALTQRIQNLEESLGLTLFVRSPRGVHPTPSGERLLRFCQARTSLEDELVDDLKGGADTGLGGTIRLAAYSTVLRSTIIPALAPLLRAHPRVLPYFFDMELRQLGDALLHGQADYIVIDRPLNRSDVETLAIGEEELVLVTSKEHEAPDMVFLDHDPDDRTTFDFLANQGDELPNLRRAFFDDIYGIMDGVALGLGRAVIPRHLAALDDRLRIVKGFKSVRTPVHLQFFKQPFYTHLHDKVLTELQKRCRF